MRKRFLLNIVVMLMWSVVALAKVGITDNAYQKLTVFGDFDSGIYIDGPVTEVRELIENAVESKILSEADEDFLIFLGSQLEDLPEASSVLMQPLGGRGTTDDTMEADTFVNQGSPGSNYGGSSEVQVGCYCSGGPCYELRGLWCCYICPGGEVINAIFNVYIKRNDLDMFRTFYTARALTSWDEYSVTWNNQPISGSESSDGCSNWPSSGWYGFAASNPVIAVCNSGASNYGLKMYGDSSWASSSHCVLPDVNLHFDTAQGSGNRAYLTINYSYSELSNLDATGSDGEIVIRWSTSYEQNNAGWNVYRALGKNEQYIKLNDILIPPYQYSYEYIDAEVTNGVNYCYKVQAVDLDSSVQMFGPVCATAGDKAPDSENGGVSITYQDDNFSATAGCGW